MDSPATKINQFGRAEDSTPTHQVTPTTLLSRLCDTTTSSKSKGPRYSAKWLGNYWPGPPVSEFGSQLVVSGNGTQPESQRTRSEPGARRATTEPKPDPNQEKVERNIHATASNSRARLLQNAQGAPLQSKSKVSQLALPPAELARRPPWMLYTYHWDQTFNLSPHAGVELHSDIDERYDVYKKGLKEQKTARAEVLKDTEKYIQRSDKKQEADGKEIVMERPMKVGYERLQATDVEGDKGKDDSDEQDGEATPVA
ncbi:hypothetical protein CCMSSC00406_0009237 [Pleurotus cornucopiae]|uniref:Uncharacterized protein n=1 Tax=Pleurotus cornucopiae TaxID=5321 RepID=A0ACB7J102_PLECO|nr:hypothetical protein CCMSSC00406_0009237 [Pleurotus cornucopiae]